MSEFREMRRKRQQLSEVESIGIMKKATSGTLALLGDNGYPYVVPISYVYHEGKLYFHSALAGHKVDAIRKCDKASFCVIDKGEVHPEKYTTFFRSVIAFGRIHIIENVAPTVVSSKDGAVRFIGNYNPVSFGNEGDNSKLYLGTDNILRHPDNNMTIGSCRAYFQINTNIGDVNGDGDIDISDVVRLVNIILGDDSSSPSNIKKVVTNVGIG